MLGRFYCRGIARGRAENVVAVAQPAFGVAGRLSRAGDGGAGQPRIRHRRDHQRFPGSSVWQTLGDQFEHVPWVGCGFWDLIQPSFMFMVGMSLPFSYARRFAEGQPMIKLGLHAAMRAVLLVFLGVFLASQSGSQPNYEFFNVLAQIGLGYIFCSCCGIVRRGCNC